MGWFGRPAARPLRLIAQSPEDLPALSALLQDSLVKATDIRFEPRSRSLTLRLNRFCHEAGASRALRALSVLRIDGVTRIQSRGIARTGPGAHQVLDLLDLSLEPIDPPAFVLMLRFAGDESRDIRLEVECLDLTLMDLSAPRRARSVPRHSL